MKTTNQEGTIQAVEAVENFQHEATYLALRRAVGWTGILLPLVLAVGNRVIFGGELFVHSISRYYHTPMRDIFVGGLCAMGLFLFYYSGDDAWEDWTGNIAGFFALGVAVVPVDHVGQHTVAGTFHLVFATSLFLTLAAYSILLYPRRRFHAGRGRRLRAVVHRICGLVIVGAVIAVAIHSIGPDCDKSTCHFTFIAETIGLVAFGASWLLEGRDLERNEEAA